MSEISPQSNAYPLHGAHHHQHPNVQSPNECFTPADHDDAFFHAPPETAEPPFPGSPHQHHLQSSENRTKPNLVRGRERALALGNAVVSVPEFAMAVARKAGVAAMDSLHNWFDLLGYLKQLRLIAMSSPEGQEAFRTDSRFKMWSGLKKWIAQSNANNEAKLERSSFALISIPAIGAAALGGIGLVNELTASNENNTVGLADVAHLGAAGAALALAGGLMHAGSRMVRKVNQTDNPSPNLVRHTNNFYAHAKLDAASSGAAVAESLVHMGGSGMWAINAGVVAISGYQVWRFWPSRASKQQDVQAHEHGHGHGQQEESDDCSHAHILSHETIAFAANGLRKSKALGGVAIRGLSVAGTKGKQLIGQAHNWLTGIGHRQAPEYKQRTASHWRATMSLGVTALALVGGLVSGDARDNSTVHASSHATSESSIAKIQPEHPTELPVSTINPTPTTECVTIQPSDSQWRIIEQRLAKFVDKEPTISAINAISMFTAVKNKADNPKPDIIHAGDCLQVPTYAATQVLYNAIERPQTSDSQLVSDIKTLTTQGDIAHVLNKSIEFERINSYVQGVLATQK